MRGTPAHRHAMAVLVITASVAVAAGCGGRDDPPAGAVTVTVTAPPSSAAGAATGPSIAAAAPPPAVPAVAPMDRSFDAGLVAVSRTDGETLVLSIDRLTVAGLDDAALAAGGVPVAPDPGERFGNQRVALYDVAVAADALFVLTQCSRNAAGVDVQSQPLTAEEFVAIVAPDMPVLITYTAGLLSRAEVNPRC